MYIELSYAVYMALSIVLFVTLALRSDATLLNWRQVIEFLSSKIGLVLLLLGGMHFLNLLLLMRVRHRPVVER